MLSVVSKSILASVLVVGVPVTGIALSSYLKFNTSNTADDEGYTIYATNGENAVTDFENDNNNKYLVQLLGDEQWVECDINVIKVESKVETGGSADTVKNTLTNTHGVLEITVTGNLDVNWQTNSIKIKQKSVATGKTIKVVTLNFLCAKHKGSWIGKTNYFVGTADGTATSDNQNKFTYCQINKSICTSNELVELAKPADGSVTTNNTLGLNLISKPVAVQSATTISIDANKEYLIELGTDDKQNIHNDHEIIIHGTDSSSKSNFSKLKPVISLGNDKFFDFVSLGKKTPTASTTNTEYFVYAVNKTSVTGFVDSSDKKYSCALRGSNLWEECSIKVFNTTDSQFNDTTTSFSAINKVVEIKFNKDIGLNWQSEKIKIQPTSVAKNTTAQEASLTILFSKDGKAQIGKTKHFVGKASVAQAVVTADSACTIDGIAYSQCNVYALPTGHDISDYKFATLTAKTKSTSLASDTHYLISVGSMENQKMSIDRTEITFSFTPVQTNSTFIEVNPVSHDEESNFLASFPAKKDA